MIKTNKRKYDDVFKGSSNRPLWGEQDIKKPHIASLTTLNGMQEVFHYAMCATTTIYVHIENWYVNYNMRDCIGILFLIKHML